MLLFIDESGHHESGTPYEVLAGVAITEDNLWNFVKAVRSAEREHFGGYLRELLSEETKGRKLLKTKRFKNGKQKPTDRSRPTAGIGKLTLAQGKGGPSTAFE